MSAQEVWDKSGVPKRFRTVRWDCLDGVSPHIKVLANEYCDHFPDKFRPEHMNGLYLYSPIPGNGKTATAVAILRELIERKKVRRQASFFSMTSVVRIIHEARRMDVDLANHSIGCRLFTSDLLVLDDVGKGKLTEWSATQYLSLFAQLYDDAKSIICTSNYAPSDLIVTLDASQPQTNKDPAFGQSVVSRICEMCERVPFEGKDYRVA